MHELTLTPSLITAPENPALTVAYAKEHIQALNNSEDTLIETWIAAATQYFEHQTGRPIMRQVWEVWLDAFPFIGASGRLARIELPFPPLLEVLSVQYLNSDGDLVDFDDGTSPTEPLWTFSTPAGVYAPRGYVEPVYGQTWPIAREDTAAVRIRFSCGYTNNTDDVPALIKGFLCFMVGHFDTFRSAVVEASNGAVLELPIGIQPILDAFKFSAASSQVLRRRWNGLLS